MAESYLAQMAPGVEVPVVAVLTTVDVAVVAVPPFFVPLSDFAVLRTRKCGEMVVVVVVATPIKAAKMQRIMKVLIS